MSLINTKDLYLKNTQFKKRYCIFIYTQSDKTILDFNDELKILEYFDNKRWWLIFKERYYNQLIYYFRRKGMI